MLMQKKEKGTQKGTITLVIAFDVDDVVADEGLEEIINTARGLGHVITAEMNIPTPRKINLLKRF